MLRTALVVGAALLLGACDAPTAEPKDTCRPADERTWYQDTDRDGWGVDALTQQACAPPNGFAERDGDCDDADPTVHPGAEELCNARDDDCDRVADNGVVSTWYTDADDDGYGVPDDAVESCEPVDGRVEDGTDCDDGDPDTHPGAPEVCDGDDDDCDGVADLGQVSTWYVDADGDGFGDPDQASLSCDPEPDWVLEAGDCDDSDAEVSPDAEETCNSVDDDCDGLVDEDFDLDGDGWGGAHCGGADCDDDDPSVHPDAEEICDDGVDNDCDGDDIPCGFSGSTSLADADGKLYASSRMIDLARLMRVGNIDGQGGDDVLAATYQADTLLGGGYVLAGPVTGTHDVEDMTVQVEGVEYTGGAGRSIAVSDTDGDGIDDLLFGAPYNAVATAYIMLGPVTADTDLDDADATLQGMEYSYCGHGADLADVNGDGWADAVVGCHGDGTTGYIAGAVTVTYGPVTGSLSLPEDADAVLTGPGEYYCAGQYMRAGMDFDGDGIGDIMTESLGDPSLGQAGMVFISHGPLSGTTSLDDADAQLLGESPNDVAGFAMAAGDLDGDGLSDAVVGGFGHAGGKYAGAAWIVHGPISGTMNLAAADAIIRGTVGATAGMGLETGDVEGDGVDELLVGAPEDPTVGSGAGAAFLFVGPLSGSHTTADALASYWAEGGADRAGRGVAFADTDNDGWSEVLIGAPYHGNSSGWGGALYMIQPEI